MGLFNFGLRSRLEAVENVIPSISMQIAKLEAELSKIGTQLHTLRGIVNRKVGGKIDEDELNFSSLSQSDKDFIASLPESEKQRLLSKLNDRL